MQNRYQKQIVLPQIGTLGQSKLVNAKVLVVGAGGLGCPVLLYLVGAGVGNIGIIDGDFVSESNLQRQILYDMDDIGKSKVLIAKKKLSKLNPEMHINIFNEYLKASNVLEIVQPYDLVVDCSDNFETRYLINDFCVLLQKCFVYGALYQFEGKVSVFNYQDGPTYRCLFPEQPENTSIPNCTETGVLGTLAGIIGSIQANEVIKIIMGVGEVLAGKLLIFNALTNNLEKINFKRNKSFLNFNKFKQQKKELQQPIKTITWNEILSHKAQGIEVLIIDVRNQEEYTVKNIGGLLIPLPELQENYHKIPRHILIAIHCQSGARSRMAIELLQNKYHFENLYNLTVDFGGDV